MNENTDRWESLVEYVTECGANQPCIHAALRYIRTLRDKSPEQIPDLACESASDGVSLEWHRGDKDAMIEFQDESVVEVVEFDGGKVVNMQTLRWDQSMEPICLAALRAVGVPEEEVNRE